MKFLSLGICCCIALASLHSCKKSESTVAPPPPPPPPPVVVDHTITSINPDNGPKGISVEITGTHFGTDPSKVKVSFNGMDATVTGVTDTKLIVTVPAKSGTGAVAVTILSKTVTGPIFTYIPGMVVSTLAGTGTSGFVNGTGAGAKFQSPILHAITDSKGNIYVVDPGNFAIRKITPDGTVSTFAGSGAAGIVDAISTAASFYQPNGITADAQDNLYVSDGCAIRKIKPDGTVTTIAGNNTGSACGYKDGPGGIAAFNYPYGLCTDASGNVYVAERGNHDVRKITPAAITSTFVGGGYGDAEGTGTAALFKYPHALCSDNSGNIFLVDQSNYKIRKITPAGVVTTFAGSGVNNRVDGQGTAAAFRTVNAICADKTGNLFFVEQNSDSTFLRMLTPTGKMSTLAGGHYGWVDGNASTARFLSVYGICIDANGVIYITDAQRIRKVVIE
ncbi:IPT/TIG domain-containing protein [Chitinophagaceae bacterium LWZ2-11]